MASSIPNPRPGSQSPRCLFSDNIAQHQVGLPGGKSILPAYDGRAERTPAVGPASCLNPDGHRPNYHRHPCMLDDSIMAILGRGSPTDLRDYRPGLNAVCRRQRHQVSELRQETQLLSNEDAWVVANQARCLTYPSSVGVRTGGHRCAPRVVHPTHPLRRAFASQSVRFWYPSVDAPTTLPLGAMRRQRQSLCGS